MNAKPGALAVISTLATIVRLHEGNRDEKVNVLLVQADEARATVERLAEAVSVREDIWVTISGPWHSDVRESFAAQVGLDRFASPAEIAHRADENVRAALAAFRGEQP